jgi:hypothetical protein
MIGHKARGAIFVFLLMLFTTFLLSSCSMREISDTFGSCCGVSPLPIGAMGLMIVCRGWKKR